MSRRPLEPDSPGAAIVHEEQELLERVHRVLGGRVSLVAGARAAATDYDAELLDLRDQLAEAKPEDIAPLVEQMTRIAMLAAGRRREGQLPVDPASPYFAHLRLAEPDGRSEPPAGTRDILIGRRGFIDREAGVQIVDWRDAPVSQIYYRYDEGDDYDEHVDDRHLEGVVTARRNLSIHHATLRRVGCPQGVFVASGEGRWFEAEGVAAPVLQGGQGKAARPPRPLGPAKPSTHGGHGGKHGGQPRRLGVHSGAVPRADKHLPEIAALIDPAQFDLITAPSTGLVIIQGGAGSGKTTVALHRVAFLVFHDPRRFRPSKCLVMVPSLALERYVAGVLPALGVQGVAVMTWRAWARSTRRKVLPGIRDRYTEESPPAIARVKKHRGLLPVLAQFVADQAREVGHTLALAPLGAEARAAVGWAWEDLRERSPVARVAGMKAWLGRAGFDAAERQRVELAIARARRRLRDVAGLWGEVLSDRGRLRAGLPATGPDAVSDGELTEVVTWVANQQEPETPDELQGIDAEARAPVDGGDLDDSDRGRAAGRLDPEDDALLLRLAQLLHGGLYRDGNHDDALLYDHLAIDEAQDYSAIEVQVLVDAVAVTHERQATPTVPLRSMTIAGDVSQRLVFDNGFRGWTELCDDIGLRGVAVRPLRLSYRSTEEVMRFAHAVLGPLAPPPDEEFAARPGAPVEVHRFDAMGEAVAFLAESLRSLSSREPTASVALIARHPAQADAYHMALARAEVPSLRRVRRQDFAFAPGIDLTDIAQVKGLEFDYVVLLDVTASNYPATVEARHLLHIGATRAAHQLWILSIGVPSPLLPAELLPAEE